jgi:hypothetical protein
MAVTGRKRQLAVFFTACAVLCAQPEKEIYRRVTQVATALTAGNAEEAMTPFDKSFGGYDRLRDYFTALTNAYQLVNGIEVTDAQISAKEATLTVHWEMSLGDSQTRSDDLIVKLIFADKKWRIADLSPIEFFNPQLERPK